MTSVKILVLSDTHHMLGSAWEAVEREQPELVLHLGDHIADAEDLACAFPETEFLRVPGNCDWGSMAAQSLVIEEAGHRLLLTHGHLFGVKQGLERLLAEARRVGAEAALFGHTHIQHCELRDGIWLVNPGACSGVSGRPGYAVLEADARGLRCRLETFV